MRIGCVGADVDGAERAALATAGCGRWVSAKTDIRTLGTVCHSGDTVVVAALDRLGPSLSAVVRAIAGLAAMGVGVTSLAEDLDLATTSGADVFVLLAAWERDQVRRRTEAGREAARALGSAADALPGWMNASGRRRSP